MNGQMKNYNYSRYTESLKNTKIQTPVKKLKIDYKSLVKYANEKGVQPCDLKKEDQERFVINS